MKNDTTTAAAYPATLTVTCSAFGGPRRPVTVAIDNDVELVALNPDTGEYSRHHEIRPATARRLAHRLYQIEHN